MLELSFSRQEYEIIRAIALGWTFVSCITGSYDIYKKIRNRQAKRREQREKEERDRRQQTERDQQQRAEGHQAHG